MGGPAFPNSLDPQAADAGSSYRRYPPINAPFLETSIFTGSGATDPFDGSAYLMPFVIPKGMSVDNLNIQVETLGAGENFTAYLFSDKNGSPDQLLAHGAEVSMGSTGQKASSFSTPWVSDGSMVWGCIWSDASSAELFVLDASGTGNNDTENTLVLPTLGVSATFAPAGSLRELVAGAYNTANVPAISTAAGIPQAFKMWMVAS